MSSSSQFPQWLQRIGGAIQQQNGQDDAQRQRQRAGASRGRGGEHGAHSSVRCRCRCRCLCRSAPAPGPESADDRAPVGRQCERATRQTRQSRAEQSGCGREQASAIVAISSLGTLLVLCCILQANRVTQACSQYIHTKPFDQIVALHLRSVQASSVGQHANAIQLQTQAAESDTPQHTAHRQNAADSILTAAGFERIGLSRSHSLRCPAAFCLQTPLLRDGIRQGV